VSAAGIQRRLAAILSADAVGYSRLMAADEEGTVRAIAAARRLITELVEREAGRIVDTPGDNVLAEFPSAVAAVACAVAIQRELRRQQADLPSQRRMLFRMGLDLGEIVCEGERVYGAGVNVAARLEGIAESGGICISGAVFDQVEGKLDVGFESAGEQRLKNIPKPVRVYRLRQAPSPRSSEKPATHPSVMVAPFRNLSPRPEDAFIARGIAEDVSTLLSRLADFAVIPRHGLREEGAGGLDPVALGREVGARYVIDGSVRRLGERVRLTVCLLDGEAGVQIWGEQYDRPLEQVLVVQDEVVAGIATALGSQLWHTEVRRLAQSRPDTLGPWALVQQALATMVELHTRESLAETEQLLRRALEMEPTYALAQATLALVLGNQVRGLYSENPAADESEALQLADEAVAMAPDDSRVAFRVGGTYLRLAHADRALGMLERSLKLDPNWAPARADLGGALIQLGRVDEGVETLRRLVRASSLDPQQWNYRVQLSIGLLLQGDSVGAEEQLRRSIDQQGRFHLSWLLLAIVLAVRGRAGEGRKALETAHRLEPRVGRERYEGLIQRTLGAARATPIVELLQTLGNVP
jgi:adenylate cyclase